MEKNNKRIIVFGVIGIVIFIFGVVGITYAFFNYTRTGASNTIKTGRISFSTGQTDTINLTNLFPISSSEVATDNDNTAEVLITVTGDTTYNEGIEYLIKTEDINLTIGEGNNKKIVPISLIVTPEKSGNLGEETSNYWEQRGGNTSYYTKLFDDNEFEKSTGIRQRLLVGYIAPGETGINGTIGIKAFIDKDSIAISDTYPEGMKYKVNDNLSQEQLSECVSYLSGLNATEAFCNGTGTITRNNRTYTLEEALEYSYIISNTQKQHLLSEGIIREGYIDGTTNEWQNSRTVLTTAEWNSLSETPLSFKVKVEANENVWVPNTLYFGRNVQVIEGFCSSTGGNNDNDYCLTVDGINFGDYYDLYVNFSIIDRQEIVYDSINVTPIHSSPSLQGKCDRIVIPLSLYTNYGDVTINCNENGSYSITDDISNNSIINWLSELLGW